MKMRVSWIAGVIGAVALPFLTACSTSGDQVSPSAGFQSLTTSLQHISPVSYQPAGGRGMIYVGYFQNGNHTPMRFYSERHPYRKLGTVRRRMYQTYQLAVNRKGTVFVANQASEPPYGGIYAFAPGALKPSKILTVPNGSGEYVYGVCTTGDTVYGAVGLALGSGPLPVYAYAHGSTKPTSTVYTYPAYDQPKACAVDSKGNLYVLYYSNAVGAIDEFAPGSQTPKTLPITLQNVNFIGVDATDNLLITGNFPSQPPGLFVFPPGASMPSRTFDSGGLPVGFAFSSSGKDLYICDVSLDSFTKSAVLVYDYASGNKIGQFWAGGQSGFFAVRDIAVTPQSP